MQKAKINISQTLKYQNFNLIIIIIKMGKRKWVGIFLVLLYGRTRQEEKLTYPKLIFYNLSDLLILLVCVCVLISSTQPVKVPNFFAIDGEIYSANQFFSLQLYTLCIYICILHQELFQSSSFPWGVENSINIFNPFAEI